jgi:ABC-type Na+ efflux pump permease subunit
MKWFIFIVVVAAILLVFGLVYLISGAVNKRKRPKYKTTAPDDDPKFLRDLAEKLKAEDEKPSKDNTDTSGAADKEDDEPK